jgi:hypothetical protein
MSTDNQGAAKVRRRSKRVIRFSDKTRDRLVQLAKENGMSVDDYVNHMLGGHQTPQAIAKDVAEIVATRLEAVQTASLQAHKKSQEQAFAAQVQAHQQNLTMLLQSQEAFVKNLMTTLGAFFKGR